MNWRSGMLALIVSAALASQASAQIFGGYGGWPNTFGGGYFPGGGWGGYGGYPGGGWGGYGGYGFSVPTVWQNTPILAYTTASTVTQPVVPPDSPAWRDPDFASWARTHGYYLRPGERAPRYRSSLYPATPVDASDLQSLPAPRVAN